MESMETSINKADLLLSESHAALIAGGSSALPGHTPLKRKLAAIYAEEATKPNKIKQTLNQTGRLISKLVEQDKLSCLVVNLYRGNEGYNIALKLPGGLESETIKLPYEDEEFLTYIDQEQLPPMLLDLLDDSSVNDLFHHGCVVAEIRDYRRYLSADPSTLSSSSQSPPYCDYRHVLLKPSTQSVISDVACLTRDKDWTPSERLKLEAELVKATAPPLCLSPNISATIMSRRLHTHTSALNIAGVKRAAKRMSQPSQNRQKKFEEGPAPKCMRLFNFLNERKDKRPLAKSIKTPLFPLNAEQTMEGVSGDLFNPAVIPAMDTFMKKVTDEVQKCIRPIEKTEDGDENHMQFVEEHILETEKGQGRLYLTKLTIYKRRSDEVYCGELYVDRDYQEGKTNGSTCTFTHTSLQSVHRYIAQFKEIFSEEGRKTCKFTTRVPGHYPKVKQLTGTRDKSVLLSNPTPEVARLPNHTLQQQKLQQQSASSATIPVASAPGVATAVPISISAYKPQNLFIVANGADRASVAAAVHKPGGTVINTTSGNNGLGVVVCRAPTASVFTGATVHHTAPVVTNISARLHHSASQLPGVVAASTQQQQQQQVVVGRNVHLGNLLSGRVAVSNVVPVSCTQQLTSHAKITATPSTIAGLGIKVGNSNDMKNNSTVGGVPALQALLAGTPSAENPAPNSRSAALIERLAQQSSNKGVDNKGTVKVDITASALPTITTINCSPSTNTLVTSVSSSTHSGSSPAAAVLRSDSGAAPPPPNINIANLQGLNVGLQNITGLQNVHVSIAGLPVPISLSVGTPSGGVGNSGATAGITQQQSVSQQQQHPVIIASPQHHQQLTSNSGNTGTGNNVVVSSGGGTQTVVLAATSLPQGHLLHLPIVQSSQLAAQLTGTKPSSVGGQQQSASTINLLQTLNSNSSSGVTASGNSMIVAASGSGGTQIVSSQGSEVLVSTANLLPRPSQQQTVLPHTTATKQHQQQYQLALHKKSHGLNQQLQQKLMQLAASKTQQKLQLQLQQQQPPQQ